MRRRWAIAARQLVVNANPKRCVVRPDRCCVTGKFKFVQCTSLEYQMRRCSASRK